MLQSDVRTPQSIIANAPAVWLPDVGVRLGSIHLVSIKGVRYRSYIVWMTDGKSTLGISRWNRWRTPDSIPYGVGFTLDVETVFVRSRRIDLIHLLLVCVRIRRMEEMRHIG